MTDGTMGAIVVAGVFFYLLPTGIAWERKHPSSTSILLLNLLLGFTVIGWFAALIWACVTPGSAAAPKKLKPPGRFCAHCGGAQISGATFCATCGVALT